MKYPPSGDRDGGPVLPVGVDVPWTQFCPDRVKPQKSLYVSKSHSGRNFVGRSVGFGVVGLGFGTAVGGAVGGAVGAGGSDAAPVQKKKLNAMYAIIGRILQWIA